MQYISAVDLGIAPIAVGLSIATANRLIDFRAEIRPWPAGAEIVACAASVAVGKIAPLVFTTGQPGNPAAYRHVNHTAVDRKHRRS